MPKLSILAASLLLPIAGAILVALALSSSAEAEGPCGTSHDAMDAEEFAFLAELQDWRDANVGNSSPLTPSGPLNAAAAWFAEYLAAGGATDGHSDNFGRDYLDRALDCGWPIIDSMGEGGIYAGTASQAASAMPHKEFEVPDDPRYYPLHCIGVGRATIGNDTVWIMLLAAHPGECPAAQLSPGTGGQTPQATSTPLTLCGTPHDLMDGEEFAFLAELQTWRDENLQHPSTQLIPSGPLNAAAAWQAEYLANNPFISNGHLDGEGRNWAQRAEDCGYDAFWAYGSGEGVFALAGPTVADVPLSDFVDGILYPGSGVTADFPSGGSSPPFRCVGVAKFHQQDPSAIAWIVILAQYPSADCPEAQLSPQEAGTPAPSPTATNTPEPTPSMWQSWVPGVTKD